MIKFTGKIKREESINGVRKSILKFQNIFISTLLLFPVIYLLFEYKVFKYDEFAMVTGDRVATCKLVNIGTPDGYCSAFLVSDNGLLITAGHCLQDKNIGDIVYVTFDKMKKAGYNEIPARIVFLPNDYKIDDYAVLQVDKELEIKKLEIANDPENPDLYNPEVVVIGYPGPDQVYDAANIVRVYNRKDDPTTFEINEIYQGMSGGPVIDKQTGEVIGIVKSKRTLLATDKAGNRILQDQEGISYCEKIQQIFTDPATSHINW